jgi:hypothetical protein
VDKVAALLFRLVIVVETDVFEVCGIGEDAVIV